MIGIIIFRSTNIFLFGGLLMELINIEDIQIPEMFKLHKPNLEKVANRVRRIQEGIALEVNLCGLTLVDGYAVYLAYKELGIKEIPYISVEVQDKVKKDIVLDVSVSNYDKIVEAVRSVKTSRNHKIIKAANYTCYICGRVLPEDELTVDHKIPKFKGGTDRMENLKCSCKICNQLKGTFTYSKALVRLIKTELIERGLLDKKAINVN